jgi:hypothetical protein
MLLLWDDGNKCTDGKQHRECPESHHLPVRTPRNTAKRQASSPAILLRFSCESARPMSRPVQNAKDNHFLACGCISHDVSRACYDQFPRSPHAATAAHVRHLGEKCHLSSNRVPQAERRVKIVFTDVAHNFHQIMLCSWMPGYPQADLFRAAICSITSSISRMTWS